MPARKSGYFRKPKTLSERRAHVGAKADDASGDVGLKNRHRKRIARKTLPDAWEDKSVAARKDRSRGKKTFSPGRKLKAKSKWK